jgi:hypothetical protein
MTALYYLNKKLKKKEDSIENGINYEQPTAKDYLTHQERNSKN